MKIGFICLPLYGHLNPMTTLARRLQSRGNEIAFIGVPDVEPFARAANLEFVSFCEKEFPAGSIKAEWAHVAKLHGKEVLNYTFKKLTPGLTKAALEHLPQTITDHGIEALVIDTAMFFLSLVPESLGVPYAHVWNVLNVDFSGMTPACMFSWPPDTTPEALARNTEANQWLGELLTPVAELAIPYAEKWGLQVDWADPNGTTSKLAVVSQIPKEFDFPNIPWPAHFHHTGPFHDERGREPIPFPWAKLDGRPLIYAAMGTLVNGLEDVYKTILKTVGPMSDFQLVLSVGHNVSIDNLRPIPSNVIVVPSAPQVELLKRATLCITHAGLNTALESLAKGVPMVAIPIGYDQPGVAARIAYHGAGEFIEFEDLTVDRLAAMIQQVQTNPSYREKAHYFQEVIAKTRGLDRASEVIEEVFEKSQTPYATAELSRV